MFLGEIYMNKEFFYNLKMLLFVPICFWMINFCRNSNGRSQTIIIMAISMFYIGLITYFLSKGEKYKYIDRILHIKVDFWKILKLTLESFILGFIIICICKIINNELEISFFYKNINFLESIIWAIVISIIGELTFRNLLCENVRWVTKQKSIAIIFSSIMASMACGNLLLALYTLPLNVENAEAFLEDENFIERVCKNIMFSIISILVLGILLKGKLS
jgi:hypothetical protein